MNAVIVAAVLLIAASGLAYVGLRQSANLFYTPALLAEAGGATDGLAGKVGGFVDIGSLEYVGATEISFRVVDGTDAPAIIVVYDGVTPDLFEEGAGVVADGAFNADGVFVARQVLA
ncbi:MAG: cytochrome c maturation protein CcmE, partial [Pseudomonadota bacterium]